MGKRTVTVDSLAEMGPLGAGVTGVWITGGFCSSMSEYTPSGATKVASLSITSLTSAISRAPGTTWLVCLRLLAPSSNLPYYTGHGSKSICLLMLNTGVHNLVMRPQDRCQLVDTFRQFQHLGFFGTQENLRYTTMGYVGLTR